LKTLERRLGGAGAERPKPGDLQLEARQLADAQRQIASSLPQTSGAGATSKDRLRQLAGEQERLAERARRMQDGAREAPSTAASALAGQRLADRMQQSADALRRAAQSQQNLDSRREAAAEEQVARDLDKAADMLQAAGNAKDRDAAQLSSALARARELRDKLDAITRELQTPGSSGQRNQLRDEAARELQRTRELIDELRRQDPSLSSGGPGFTFEGQGMTFSSPGTEGFKQDFARWQELRDQATAALARVETALSKQLQDRQAGDRLAAGVDDKAPASYRSQVDDYFKAIAAKKTP
jgi:DNA repair exonuclease SbcCD ATPase subunit